MSICAAYGKGRAGRPHHPRGAGGSQGGYDHVGPASGSGSRSGGQAAMIHFVLHDARDTVAVVVVEGVKAGTPMTGWIMDEDRTMQLDARQDIPIGHKVALKDMRPGDTVLKYGIDMGKVVAPIRAGEHAHVQNIKTKRW
jgi:(2R)-sulfolactate sulfo-lyase subunit alpha